MKIIVVAPAFPKPDEASGDLRLFSLIKLLSNRAEIIYCAAHHDGTLLASNQDTSGLASVGVTIGEGDVAAVLKQHSPDLIWFEFYFQARGDFVRLIRHLHPDARIIVDSVDVHFNRLYSRARLSGNQKDLILAQEVKDAELASYARSDMIIAVSENDKILIENELHGSPVAIIPNIHAVPPFSSSKNRRSGEMLFVGGFKHEPNVDAMLYFCHEVLPLILAENPQARLKVVGSHPPPVIQALASQYVEIIGYVPETQPYLLNAYVSIAPLRYGGGMKGKVGEAMAHGLPVVTTSIGAEGFGVEPGKHLLVGDSPEIFARHVLNLLDDELLHSGISRAGYEFVSVRYSPPAIERLLFAAIETALRRPARREPFVSRCRHAISNLYGRHIAWRLGK